MFDINELLTLSNELDDSKGTLVEVCGEYVDELEGLYIYCPESSYSAIVEYIKGLPNSGYALKTFNKNVGKALQLLLAHEKLSSYTAEFVKIYGGTQEVLDSIAGTESFDYVNTNEEPVFSESSIEDSVDTESFSESVPADMPADYVAETNAPIEDSADLDKNETSIEEDNSYSMVSEEETKAPSTNAQLQMEQNTELYLMVRGIAQALGLTEFDDSETLTIEDVKVAKVYFNNLSAQSIREGLIGVLDGINTKADLRMITRFIKLFLTHLKQNNITR